MVGVGEAYSLLHAQGALTGTRGPWDRYILDHDVPHPRAPPRISRVKWWSTLVSSVSSVSRRERQETSGWTPGGVNEKGSVFSFIMIEH